MGEAERWGKVPGKVRGVPGALSGWGGERNVLELWDVVGYSQGTQGDGGEGPRGFGGVDIPKDTVGVGVPEVPSRSQGTPIPSTHRLLSSRMGPQRVRSMAGPGRARLTLCTSWS